MVLNNVRRITTASFYFSKFLQPSSMQVSSLHMLLAEGLQQYVAQRLEHCIPAAGIALTCAPLPMGLQCLRSDRKMPRVKEATSGLMVMENRRTMSRHCTTSCGNSCAPPDLHEVPQNHRVFPEVGTNLTEMLMSRQHAGPAMETVGARAEKIAFFRVKSLTRSTWPGGQAEGSLYLKVWGLSYIACMGLRVPGV